MVLTLRGSEYTYSCLLSDNLPYLQLVFEMLFYVSGTEQTYA
jgi:hypothetical protein